MATAVSMASMATPSSSTAARAPTPTPPINGSGYENTAEPAPLVARGVSDDLASLTDQTAGEWTMPSFEDIGSASDFDLAGKASCCVIKVER